MWSALEKSRQAESRGIGARPSLIRAFASYLTGAEQIGIVANPLDLTFGPGTVNGPGHSPSRDNDVPTIRPADVLTVAPCWTGTIEDVRVCDSVLSFNPGAGRLEPRRVLQTVRRRTTHLRILSSIWASQDPRTTKLAFWVMDGSRQASC
jgi:hypothetical protein